MPIRTTLAASLLPFGIQSLRDGAGRYTTSVPGSDLTYADPNSASPTSFLQIDDNLAKWKSQRDEALNSIQTADDYKIVEYLDHKIEEAEEKAKPKRDYPRLMELRKLIVAYEQANPPQSTSVSKAAQKVSEQPAKSTAAQTSSPASACMAHESSSEPPPPPPPSTVTVARKRMPSLHMKHFKYMKGLPSKIVKMCRKFYNKPIGYASIKIGKFAGELIIGTFPGGGTSLTILKAGKLTRKLRIAWKKHQEQNQRRAIEDLVDRGAEVIDLESKIVDMGLKGQKDSDEFTQAVDRLKEINDVYVGPE